MWRWCWIIGALLLATPVQADVLVRLTDAEEKALLQLIDLAVKSQGLSVAGNADFLARKIQSSPQAPNPPTGEVPSSGPAAPGAAASPDGGKK